MKPFIKWVGSKRRFINILDGYLPSKIKNYFEPFAGSASMAFHLLSQNTPNGEAPHRIDGIVTISDTNTDLMSAYRCLVSPIKRAIVLEKLSVHRTKHSYRYFDKVKKEGYDDLTDIAARFLYFNRASFSGIYRVNSQDRYNVSSKTSEQVVWLDDDVYINAGKLLRKSKLLCTDYAYILNEVKAGDFVFLDPPYHRIALSRQRMYTSKHFEFEDQIKLKMFCDSLDKKGVYWLQTNSDEKEMIDLYSDYHTVLMPVKYTSHGIDSSVSTNEIIVRNY